MVRVKQQGAHAAHVRSLCPSRATLTLHAQVYGRTSNPCVSIAAVLRYVLLGNGCGGHMRRYSTAHIVGGSSGGEAALVAACGVPVGVGSDVGGTCCSDTTHECVCATQS